MVQYRWIFQAVNRILVAVVFLLLASLPSQASSTFVQSAANECTGSGTTCAMTVSATGAGNLLVVFAKSEVGGATTVTASDGTTSFSIGPNVLQTGGDLYGQWLYLLSSNSGKTTITVTWAAARSFKRVRLMEYSASGAFSLDGTGLAVTYDGSIGLVDSGNITTTGSDEVAFGMYGEANGTTPSTPLIDLLAADQSTDGGGNFTTLWSRAFASTFTGSASIVANGPSIVGILAFSIGGGPPPCTPTLTLMGVGRCG